MPVFVDTSALMAILDRSDLKHPEATTRWKELLTDGRDLRTSNYVVLESSALSQRRLGTSAVRVISERFRPLLRTYWVGQEDHDRAELALLAANRRQLSLVDCTSFLLMRQHGIRRCFAYDQHFEEQGFEVLG